SAGLTPSTTPRTRVPVGRSGSSTVAVKPSPGRLRSELIVSLSRTFRTVSAGKSARRESGRAAAIEAAATIRARDAHARRSFIGSSLSMRVFGTLNSPGFDRQVLVQHSHRRAGFVYTEG